MNFEDFVLNEKSDNVEKDWNDAHSEFDMLDFNDFEDIGKVLKDVLKPEAHGHIFCSALNFLYWNTAFSLKQNDAWGGSRKTFGEVRSTSGKSESVQLRPAFEIENSALLCIRAVKNYRKLKLQSVQQTRLQ